jgi:hypothetical protein
VSYAISLSGTTVSIASPGPRGVGVPTGGTTGQVLAKASATDYDFAWSSASGGLSNVVEDTTPQLGGNLDVNGQSIVSASNGDIAITPNGTGSIILDGLTWPSADGTANQVLKTAGDGTLSFGDASTVAALNDLTDVSVGSEAASDVLVYRSGSGWINDSLTYDDVLNNIGSGSAASTSGDGNVSAGTITDVIALSQDQYDNLTAGVDPSTLYVITNGTTSIADSDDVTITGTPSDHSFLVYDSATSDWINRTAAQAQADLGISAFGTTLIDDADAATARTTLGLANVKTDSYVGHIEAPADGTYYIDANPVVNKTITELYLKWSNDGSNAGTLTLVVDATTVDTVDLSSASNPYTSSALNQAATSGDEIKITLSSVADVSDLRFVVEYTQ